MLLAHGAEFIYAPLGIATAFVNNDALIGAVKELIASRKLQIILLAWGSSEPNDAIDTLIKQSADKILFVLPAGNNFGKPSGYKKVVGVALVVAAVTADGAQAPFTSASDDVVWAPGTDISVVVPTLNGTSFSAALAAGAAAVLLHDFSNRNAGADSRGSRCHESPCARSDQASNYRRGSGTNLAPDQTQPSGLTVYCSLISADVAIARSHGANSL
jgi:hypothetical protein